MIDDENYYEMVTEDWPQLTDKKKEWDQFQLGGYLWNIYSYPNRNGYVQLNLCLISAYVMKNEFFYADVVFYLRNVYDYSCIVARRWKKMQHFSNSDGLIFFKEFIKSEEVYQLKEGSSNRLLLENGKIVIGVYIRIYENDEITKLPKRNQLLNIDNEENNNPEKTELKLKKEQYIRELKNQVIMDELENSMTFNANAENYFEFELYKFADNFIKKNFETCRFGFKLGGHRWEMNLNSIGELKKRTDNFWISLTLLDYRNLEEEEEEEEIWIKCLYSFRDIENPSNYRSFDVSPYFCYNSANENNYTGYRYNIYYMDYDEFIEPFIKNDKIIIGIYLRIYNSNKIKEQFSNKLKKYIITNDENLKVKVENFFEIPIDRSIVKQNGYGDTFKLDQFDQNFWNFLVNIDEDGWVKFKLDMLSLKENDNIYASVVFYIRNRNDFSCIEAKCWDEIKYFYPKDNVVTYDKFIKTSDLYVKRENSNQSLAENHKAVFGVYIRQYELNEKTKLPKRRQDFNDQKEKKEDIEKERYISKKTKEDHNETDGKKANNINNGKTESNKNITTTSDNNNDDDDELPPYTS